MTKYTPILVILIFCISPFWSLPLLLVEVYNKRKYAMIFLAIFFAGISMFYFPFGDQYRYYNDLQNYKYLSFNDVFDVNDIMAFKHINLINLFVFVSSKINLTIEQVRFILVLISYLIFIYIYSDIVANTSRDRVKYKNHCIGFIIFFFSVPLYLISYGFRTGFGITIFVLGVYLIYKGKIKSGYLCVVLSCLVHVFFILYFALLIVSRISKLNIKPITAIIVGISFSLMSYGIIGLLYGKFEVIDILLNAYVYGDWGTEYRWDMGTIKEMVLTGILPICICYYLLMTNHNNTHWLIRFLYCIFILLLFSIPYATLFQRILRTLIPILILYYINNLFYIKRYYKYRNWVLTTLIIAFLIPFYLHREKYAQAHIERICYYSLPQILRNTYNVNDINAHVYYNGEFCK